MGAMRASQRGVFDNRDRRVGIAEDPIILGQRQHSLRIREQLGRGGGLRRFRRHQDNAQNPEESKPDVLHNRAPYYHI